MFDPASRPAVASAPRFDAAFAASAGSLKRIRFNNPAFVSKRCVTDGDGDGRSDLLFK